MSLKAQHNTAAKSLAQTKPKCPRHAREMVFLPSELKWQCPSVGCSNAAYPKHEDTGRPVLGKGELELLVHKDEDGKVYTFLRATGNNVMIELPDEEGLVELRVHHVPGKPTTADLSMFLSRVTTLDEFGRRRAR